MAHHVIYYVRVSTADQTVNSQLDAIIGYAADIVQLSNTLISETCSGSTSWRSRRLAEVLDKSVAPCTLIAYELSRLGRSTLDVLQFLAACRERSIEVRIVKGNMRIDDSMNSKVLTTIISLAAELERDFLIARTREGLATARAKGRIGGRRPGPSPHHQLDPKANEIQKLLTAGVPKTAIAKLLDVSRNTVYRYLDRTTITTTTPNTSNNEAEK